MSRWHPPEAEASRMEAIRAGIGEARIVPHPECIVFVLAKNTNNNVVLYEWAPDTRAPTASWLSLEPSERARHEREGNASLRSELNAMEEALFGLTVVAHDPADGSLLVHLNHPAIQSRVFRLIPGGADATAEPPVLLGSVGAADCVLSHAYCQLKPSFIDVEWIHLHGRELSTGRDVVETIVSPM
jgi:hypothetical protein